MLICYQLVKAGSETCRILAPYVSGEELSGGETTVFDISPNAYTLAARNLSRKRRRQFAVGDSFFNDNWVIAPASTTGRDGLGPLFNATSCSSCHVRDGRGNLPDLGDPLVSAIVRLSIPGDTFTGAPNPEPHYGDQFQQYAILRATPEGEVVIRYEETLGEFPDGRPYSLKKPIVYFENLRYGRMSSNTMVSLRIAPAVFGLGLLAAIDESTLLRLADPKDRDGDGISGRPTRLWCDQK